MSTYYQRNRQKLLNRAEEYYGNNKERLTKQVKNIDNYLIKGKIKRENMRRNIYKNLSEKNKQILKGYQKNVKKST